MANNFEKEHINMIRKITPECMVLLKADGKFPLQKPEKIALYGCGARRTLKGGRGSGDVNVKSFPTIEQGLKNAGFEITTADWLETYEIERKKAIVKFRGWLKKKIAAEGMDVLMENLSIVMPEPEYSISLEGEGKTAVYVLSRLCGEGVDRQSLPGDLYLSNTEIRDILQLQKQYERFMLVLNTGCVVDLSPIASLVDNILLLSQPGMTVGDSFADVLLGKEYPSGKLAVTWTAAEDYSTIGEFGNRDDSRYKEGIYVGYRYFDTVGEEVLFPFGHGLGYTNFNITCEKPSNCGSKIRIPVTVENTGSCPGKEVVQLYVSVPEGRLDQPFQVLGAFKKTQELLPGKIEKMYLEIQLESLASYCETLHSRILEKGSYLFRIGNSSRNTKPVCVVELKESVIVEKVNPISGLTDFKDWKPEKRQENNLYHVPFLEVSDENIQKAEKTKIKVNQEAMSLAKEMSDEELAYLCTGDFVGEGSKSIIGDAAITVAGAAGETTSRFKHLGVQNLVMADGPAGLRLSREYGIDDKGIYVIEQEEENNNKDLIPENIMKALMAAFPAMEKKERSGKIFEQNCTAIPIAAAIAQSWNEEIAKQCGRIVGEEMEHFGIHIWLAPALNIQRHPLCGRNFEYYSEDPLISGKMTAAITKGVQESPGKSVTIKHFICNNQETNRFRTNSMVNERAVRDIYARGFEIAVKESKPGALMTSYNLLNGIHPSENESLLETMLRQEWGFDGIVMSDFLGGNETEADKTNQYRKFYSVPSVRAGLDLLMPGGKEHFENMLQALHDTNKETCLDRETLEVHAARMIDYAWKLCGKDESKITF
ncbi:glycoside hydrolase family 3 N-terminal domain-containing protein [Robinsoniella peoriensis]